MTGRFDVAVIGGGIHGAGVAQAAAAAGHSICVLEQFDGLARGTSGRSSKLIHGGLRYLETFQLALVRVCLYERALLLKNASQLVRLVPVCLPVYRHSRRSAWRVRSGLLLYGLLGGLTPECRFETVPKREWRNLDGLETHGLRAVFRYFDAQTDDVALTQAVMRSAQALGAHLITGARVTHVDLSGHGAEVVYQSAHAEEIIRARVVVNAAGPWVNLVLQSATPNPRMLPVSLVQGAHIIVPGTLTHGIYYAEAPRDGRPVFFMPWRGNTLVGTTETAYSGDPAEVAPLPTEIDYLLAAHAATFPTRVVSRDEVIDAFAGLRVLPTKDPSLSVRPRETRLLTDRMQTPRLTSIN